MQPDDQRVEKTDYTVIPRVMTFLKWDNRLLLLQGSPDKKRWPGMYNGPGGHVEPGETPYQAVVRELQEETGLVVPELVLRGVVHITMPQPPGVMLFVFTGEVTFDPGELRDSVEGLPVWVPLDELDTLPLVDDLYVLLPRILEAPGIVSARYILTGNGLQIEFD
ncbi:MAG: NUDIX domain-containing protein [Anaerolineae bacterium]|nr:NUDIX domain-containing protein [Anaerolineae bacterium]